MTAPIRRRVLLISLVTCPLLLGSLVTSGPAADTPRPECMGLLQFRSEK